MLTKPQITNLFQVQAKLNESLNPDWTSANNDWGTAILSECSELADAIGWKWWKHQEPAPTTQIHLEIVDIWHFVLSACIEDGLEGMVTNKILSEVDYWDDGGKGYDRKRVLHRTKVMAATACLHMRDPLRLLPELFSLMRAVRLPINEMYELYMGKSVLNLFRWANGYREGTYQKQWGEVEDNVYLESILHSKPGLGHEQITRLLNERYKEIAA